MIEIDDQFILPCGFMDEIFTVVGMRPFNKDIILDATSKDNNFNISINAKEIEPIGKEFHPTWKS